jgi:hypothetical protein
MIGSKVPLMRHPTNKRKYCVSCERFTDQMQETQNSEKEPPRPSFGLEIKVGSILTVCELPTVNAGRRKCCK